MKLSLISILLTLGTTLGEDLTSAKYTITNAQYTGGSLSASSISEASSKPQAFQIHNELSKSSTNSASDDAGNDQLKTWQLNSVGNGYWTLQNAVTKQYLVPQAGNTLKFSKTSPFPWRILPLPGDLYLITCSNNQYALALKGPTTPDIDLSPATGAVTQNWVFTKVE
ncbi:hypothetical protein CONCODRAFT_2769 [Conidiobolus coronatus NRRL 28638]|uniref:Ricin B lectin domain-containing protein n=1 Tax=Conidiobolus coronatus (strain ATCC 28846 / CBS 209.66 / NRRL 28638) TaxID=796925 RepID=A0A137PGV8_CONC2|nr:hypothetical protein CONCODRAFT_2769 [Conidiobolus coronatus NRRL 28638]|eukprot:KXN74233.1 hypothetical protein CONCODRAFT_2769 [Conidiobolus coronatus NRRL 28638]